MLNNLVSVKVRFYSQMSYEKTSCFCSFFGFQKRTDHEPGCLWVCGHVVLTQPRAWGRTFPRAPRATWVSFTPHRRSFFTAWLPVFPGCPMNRLQRNMNLANEITPVTQGPPARKFWISLSPGPPKSTEGFRFFKFCALLPLPFSTTG